MRSPISLSRLFRKSAPPERPLHEIERRMAKEYIKRRLTMLYPELREDPTRLERAYQELGLDHKGVIKRAEGEIKNFEMTLPLGVRGALDRA